MALNEEVPRQAVIKVPVIWVIGGPGSGKGTQCEKIACKYGFIHLSVGQLLRDEMKSGSRRKNNDLKAIMDRGELVPDDMVLDLLKHEILARLCEARGFLIDGFPRELTQGLMFEKKITPVTCVLFYDTSEHTMMERLMKRAKSSGRSDDNEETMKKRIVKFNNEIGKILEEYEFKIKRIISEGTADQVFTETERHLDALVKKQFMHRIIDIEA